LISDTVADKRLPGNHVIICFLVYVSFNVFLLFARYIQNRVQRTDTWARRTTRFWQALMRTKEQRYVTDTVM